MRRLHCGPFEPEAHWRPHDLARLPSLGESSARRISAMEEMLFAFCGPGDALLSYRPLHPVHLGYLQSLGYAFDAFSVDDECAAPPRLFDDALRSPELRSRLAARQDLELAPFAVTPGARDFADAMRIGFSAPDLATVVRVNAKSYSLDLRRRLELGDVGVLVEDPAELVEVGSGLLGGGPILVKDEFGVSGKGNQYVDSPAVLERLGAYAARQVAKGSYVRFVVEPLLQKRLDFSCQLHVDVHGAVTVRSVQELRNVGLAFGASFTPGEELTKAIRRGRYLDAMERIGRALFADGYYGEVCVDSLLLASGEVFPLVEINARKSMSLIKQALDRRLGDAGRPSSLGYVDVRPGGQADFGAVLQRLRSEGLLFELDRRAGVVPLTSSLLRIGAPRHDEGARMYFAAYAADGEQLERMARAARTVLDDMTRAEGGVAA